MRIVQVQTVDRGRRLGVINGDKVLDVTEIAGVPTLRSVYEAFQLAEQRGSTLNEVLSLRAKDSSRRLDYKDLLAAEPGGRWPYLLPPVDHPDPYHLLITGTGLTHLGSMKSRDEMHVTVQELTSSGSTADDNSNVTAAPQTDSAKMFDMGLAGGKPTAGQRGVAPEWFYKGNGSILRGPRAALDVPEFALDGGEEPELVGCYVIDRTGRPVRLGFSIGNEWSDHPTEKINYLYLAPSKLRTCSVGPELNTDCDFQEIPLRCTVTRGKQSLYDSGPLFTGEKHMCHSLANLEDHHFKYPQHRSPGDVHLHFLGTSKLSFGSRTWQYADGDLVKVEAPGFSAPLTNRVVRVSPTSSVSVTVGVL
jgi:hypothetical protein